jgi:hypothetical protein
MDDDELIAALAAGDDTALRELFMANGAPRPGAAVCELVTGPSV